jgi:hypothetical protein
MDLPDLLNYVLKNANLSVYSFVGSAQDLFSFYECGIFQQTYLVRNSIHFTNLFYNSRRNIDIFGHSKVFFMSWPLEEISVLIIIKALKLCYHF